MIYELEVESLLKQNNVIIKKVNQVAFLYF